MPELTDPDRLAAYLNALENRHLTGFVRVRLSKSAQIDLKEQLETHLYTDLIDRMFEYVSTGGKIDEIVETRAEWRNEWEFHHDLRFAINDRLVYVETRLQYRCPFRNDESSILVVNVHDV